MKPLLLIFVVICGIYGANDFKVHTEGKSRYNKQFIRNPKFSHIPYNLPSMKNSLRLMICTYKLLRLSDAYKDKTTSITKMNFFWFCNEFKSTVHCFDVAKHAKDDDETIRISSADLHECYQPFIKTVSNVCSLSYDVAKRVKLCYDKGIMLYKNSQDFKKCRQQCCNNTLTSNIGSPYHCDDLETHDYNGWSCFEPKLNQSLKNNACMEICAIDHLSKYAKNCQKSAIPVFQTYVNESMTIYERGNKCFMTC